MKKKSRSHRFALDCSLRSLYYSFRSAEVSIMAIEFKHKGRIWRADTIEEAVTLRKKLESEDEFEQLIGDRPDRTDLPLTHDVVAEILKSVGQLQKRFLLALADRDGGDEKTSDVLIARLGLESEIALAGVLGGLSKQVKKIGEDPSVVYSVRVLWSGKKKTRHFKMTNQFLWAASEVGWPEKWH